MDVYGHRSDFVNFLPQECHQKQLFQNEMSHYQKVIITNTLSIVALLVSCGMDTDQEFSLDNYVQPDYNGINHHLHMFGARNKCVLLNEGNQY